MSIVGQMIAEYSSALENGLDCNAAWDCAISAGATAEQAEIANARNAALEEVGSRIEKLYIVGDWDYGFGWNGALNDLKDWLRNHASQQPHAVDLLRRK